MQSSELYFELLCLFVVHMAGYCVLFFAHVLFSLFAHVDHSLLGCLSDIKPGRIMARAGLLQAAINVEFDSLKFSAIDVLTQGINGNLPNLDLVNVVHRLAREERIDSRVSNRVRNRLSF